MDDREVFDEGLESESTSAAQAAENRAAIAARRDRQVEHLEATLAHVSDDEVEAVKARIAALRDGVPQEAAEAPADEETP